MIERTRSTVLRFLLVLAVASGPALAAASDPDLMQHRKSFQRKLTQKVHLDYLLDLPEGYQPRGARRWPLLLFLHGAGERGTNLAKVATHGPPLLAKQGRSFPFIVVSPQCPAGETWSTPALLALLDDLHKRYRVDPRRVYLTGLSMGGFGTWALAAAHPERFAAIAPVCGGGDIVQVLLAEGERRKALKSLPVWAFHGAKDPVVKAEESERMVRAFRDIGNSHVKLTVYPEAGHDAWTETYNNPKFYEWLLEQRR
ncbi:MAG TPA: prolyl oligopeptidase family serine peptidase [Methylomirabilota bacterium]|nr:prolyl oligopeptidase family serine peptidase [Methylomirabilota bacterium]